MIEDRVPHLKLGAGYQRSNELIRELAATGTELTLFPMFKHAETWEAIRRSIPATVEVMVGYSAENFRSFLKERRDYYDAVLVCRPHNMREFLAVSRNHRELIGHSSIWV